MSSPIIFDNVIQEDCFSLMQPDFLSIINDSTDENWFLLDTKQLSRFLPCTYKTCWRIL
jgi:hypothetical protein